MRGISEMTNGSAADSQYLIAQLKSCSHVAPCCICARICVMVQFRMKGAGSGSGANTRSEEHTSELQSHLNLVCPLLLEKKIRSILAIRLIIYIIISSLHT